MKIHGRELQDWVLVQGTTGDYSAFICGSCGKEAKVTVGADPTVPRLDFECVGCGKTGMTKLALARYARLK